MAKVDDEILTMSRIKKLLLKHDRATRERITSWLLSVGHDGDSAPVEPVSSRQVPMFGAS